jgi:hypothetical protein
MPRRGHDLEYAMPPPRQPQRLPPRPYHHWLRCSDYRNPLSSDRMTSQQLTEKVAPKTELGKADVEVAVGNTLEPIPEAFRSNERVTDSHDG